MDVCRVKMGRKITEEKKSLNETGVNGKECAADISKLPGRKRRQEALANTPGCLPNSHVTCSSQEPDF